MKIGKGRGERSTDEGSRQEEYSQIWNDAQAAKTSGAGLFGFATLVSEFSNVMGMAQKAGHRMPLDLLNEVEKLGWRLESSEYVYVTTYSGSAGSGGLSSQTTRGVVQGYFLFRSV